MSLLVLAWLATALAADAPEMRQPLDRDALAVDVGARAIAVGWGVAPGLTVATRYDPGAYVEAAAGTTSRLTGRDRVWGLEATGSVGLAALLATPGVGLTAHGALAGGARGDHLSATLGLVTPIQVRPMPPVQLAVPLGLEPRLGVRLGSVWLGLRAVGGAVLSPGGAPALWTDAGVTVRTRPRSAPEGAVP